MDTAKIIRATLNALNDDAEYPLYLMKIDKDYKFLTLKRAGVVYDSGWEQVEIEGTVLVNSHSTRFITQKERDQIVEIADKYSASK